MKYYLLFILTLFYVNSTAQEANCDKFHTGQFKFLGPDSQTWLLTRTSVKQIEYNPNTGAEVHMKIQWISECDYILRFEKFINLDSMGLEGRKIYTRIIEVTGNTAKCAATFENSNVTMDIIKIK